ncbi:CoA-acylating methylmalonate-semialdehyde dehydrogenase [Brevibacillus agri]|uniref:CoA-acylating methylmalonate-semialdehyde dehydrogenase n=1 Tax=Brevibacillus agri TaxID=51101 RepID=UPI002E1D88FD|nr:CoA-acylating methylmalonate-semialdehyde dehydrogenase [Brevibacillus agri]MED1657284.1 CoA-acylating methylmalonate-semialdehyde dehydrogenase [Brevibacillus agri]MED1688531.1 CoA-acylating methylmalonate-semialdehyde dehydrogenase [Brevibacillus agri]MED1697754.1 CoA-acylating methylmalonate-semialdehyde dehydrogenase [Brevibacillus agri]MED1701509.1 CoA-acylating methylmalonate-semialdehyde dehydrogenase [Brevibacillus agri]
MTTTAVKRIRNFINGEWIPSSSDRFEAVINPATGQVIAEVPLSSREDLEAAVKAAEEAYTWWRKTPVPNRTRILYRYHQLLVEHAEELAVIITKENGKNIKDSRGEVQRGIEALEVATATPTLMMGQALPEIATGIEGVTYRYPLGVVAGITPFNFPMMIPLWMFPLALACGNTFVLKPSERTPLLAEKLVELMMEAGLPKGVLNMVHGAHDVVNGILEHPAIKAISFVGSQPVAEYVYKTGAANGKRVQALAGAKNHAVVMSDCHLEKTVHGIINGAFGSAGERCMATSVVCVMEDIADAFIARLVEEAKQLLAGDTLDESAFIAPLIRDSHRKRALSYIESGEEQEASLLLDGRSVMQELPDGYYLGATIFEGVTPEMKIWQDEIFAPVLSIVRVKSLDEAIELANKSNFANGAVLYTTSGENVRHFRENIDAGMIGVNVNVPAPMAFFTFAGNKASFYGDLGTNGTDGVQFFTRKKTVTARWF